MEEEEKKKRGEEVKGSPDHHHICSYFVHTSRLRLLITSDSRIELTGILY